MSKKPGPSLSPGPHLVFDVEPKTGNGNKTANLPSAKTDRDIKTSGPAP